MTDWPGWEQQVESLFGASSQQDTAIWDAWQAHEGAGGAYNPLNTTTPVVTPYGAGVRSQGSWNTAGVLDYPNPQAGAWATREAVRQNAPGFAQGLSVVNPLDEPDAQLEAGFNWLGGGAGTQANQAYAASIVSEARQATGTAGGGGGPGPAPGAPMTGAELDACVSTCIKQGGDPQTCCSKCGGTWSGGLCVTTGGTAGQGTTGGKSGKGLIDCISNAGSSSILFGAIDIPGSKQFNQIGCFFSLDGFMVVAGFVLVVIGAGRLAGVRLPSVVPVPV